MGSPNRQMKLGMFMREAGHHIAAWRAPDAPKSPGNNVAHMVGLAQLAERGLFDMLFWADSAGIWAATRQSSAACAGPPGSSRSPCWRASRW